jgi:Skp family chaperone for outer membrane proteins
MILSLVARGWAKLTANISFVVLLVVAGIGAGLYVKAQHVRADRDDLLARVEKICERAGQPFEATGKVARGVACSVRVAGLADFKAKTDELTAATLAKALADHDARQLTDNQAARSAAEAARAAALRMEIADANAERRNLVDREWFAAVNGVAGLRAAPTR